MFRCLILVGLSLLITGCAPPEVKIAEPGRVPLLQAGTHKESIEVPNVGNVKFALRVNEGYDRFADPVPLVLVLHYGYEGTRPDPYTGADMMDAFQGAVNQIGGIAIAPDVVGGDWRSAKNESAAVWLVKSAMNTYNIDPSQVYITGYSMGGEGTWHIGGNHQDLFTGAVPVAAPVTGTEQWKIPVFVIHSQQDQVVPYAAAKRHVEAIEKAGGEIKLETINGLTHYDTPRYGEFVKRGVEWLRSGQESGEK